MFAAGAPEEDVDADGKGLLFPLFSCVCCKLSVWSLPSFDVLVSVPLSVIIVDFVLWKESETPPSFSLSVFRLEDERTDWVAKCCGVDLDVVISSDDDESCSSSLVQWLGSSCCMNVVVRLFESGEFSGSNQDVGAGMRRCSSSIIGSITVAVISTGTLH